MTVSQPIWAGSGLVYLPLAIVMRRQELPTVLYQTVTVKAETEVTMGLPPLAQETVRGETAPVVVIAIHLKRLPKTTPITGRTVRPEAVLGPTAVLAQVVADVLQAGAVVAGINNHPNLNPSQ